MSADTGSARSGEQLHGELLRRWSEAKAAEKPSPSEFEKLISDKEKGLIDVEPSRSSFAAVPPVVCFHGSTDSVLLTLNNRSKAAHTVRLKANHTAAPWLQVTGKKKLGERIAQGMEAVISLHCTALGKSASTILTFSTDEGDLTIPVLVVGPRSRLHIPDKVDLGIAVCKHASAKTVTVKNSGSATALFAMHADRPFGISPGYLSIPPGEHAEVEVSFSPTKMGKHAGELVIMFEHGELTSVDLQGKCTEIEARLDSSDLQLAENAIGMIGSKVLTFRNWTSHALDFKWCRYAMPEVDDAMGAVDTVVSDSEAIIDALISGHSDQDQDGNGAAHGNDRPLAAGHPTQSVESSNLFGSNPQQDVIRIDPAMGTIPPKSLFDFTVIFSPTVAKLHTDTAYLQVDGFQDRIPLTISGLATGAQLTASTQDMDLGHIMVHERNNFEIQLTNTSLVAGDFKVELPDTEMAKDIAITPDSGAIQPGGMSILQISLVASRITDFDETFVILVDNSDCQVHVRLRAVVVGPLLHFNPESLVFDDVGYGFPTQANATLINTSTQDIRITLTIRYEDDDGDSAVPRFDLEKVEKAPLGACDSCTFWVRSLAESPGDHTAVLVVEVEGIEQILASMPIAGKCIIPQLSVPRRLVDLRENFVDLWSEADIQVHNEEWLPLNFSVEIPVKESSDSGALECDITGSRPLKPGESATLHIRAKALALGSHSLLMKIGVVGSEIMEDVEVRFSGLGPVVSLSVPTNLEMEWGKIPVLKESQKSFSLRNESGIPATVTLESNAREFTLSTNRVKMVPGGSADVVITAFVKESKKFVGVVSLHVDRGAQYRYALSAIGYGSTLHLKPVLPFLTPLLASMVTMKPVARFKSGEKAVSIDIDAELKAGLNVYYLDLKRQYSRVPIARQLTIANDGLRVHECSFSTWGYSPSRVHHMRMVQQEAAELGKTSAPITEAMTPSFSITPDSFVLRPGDEVTVTVKGFSKSVRFVQERLLMHTVCGQNVYKEKAMSIDVACKFVEPMLNICPDEMAFRQIVAPGDAVQMQEHPLRLCNVTELPIECTIAAHYPFGFRLPHSERPCEEAAMRIPAHTEATILVQFDPAYQADLFSRKIAQPLSVIYKDHVEVDTVPLHGAVFFPNIALSKLEIDFGHVQWHTRKTESLFMRNIGKVPVAYRWELHWANDADEDEGVVMEEDTSSESSDTDDGDAEGASIPDPLPLSVVASSRQSKHATVSQTSADSQQDQPVPSSEENAERSGVSRSRHSTAKNGVAGGESRGESRQSFRVDTPHGDLFVSQPALDSRASPRSRRHSVQKRFKPFSQLPKVPPSAGDLFDVMPVFGTIHPGNEQMISFDFAGKTGACKDCKAVCRVDGGPIYTVKLSGVASKVKYSLSTKYMDVGSILFNVVHTEDFFITNLGKGPFTFSVYPAEPCESLSRCDVVPEKGKVAPGSRFKLQLKIFAGLPDVGYSDFGIRVQGHRREQVRVKWNGQLASLSLTVPRVVSDGYIRLARVAQQSLKQRGLDISSEYMIEVLEELRRVGSEPHRSDALSTAHMDTAVTSMADVLSSTASLKPPPEDIEDTAKLQVVQMQIDAEIDRVWTAEYHVRRYLDTNTVLKSLPEHGIHFGQVNVSKPFTTCFKAVNASPWPVAFHLDQRQLECTGFYLTTNRLREVRGMAFLDVDVHYDPHRRLGKNSKAPRLSQDELERALCKMCGNIAAYVIFEVPDQPSLALRLQADLYLPTLDISKRDVQFATTKAGECSVQILTLANLASAPLRWHVEMEKPKKPKLDKFMPLHLRKQAMAESLPKSAFSTHPVEGEIDTRDTQQLSVIFTPLEEKQYKESFKIVVEGLANTYEVQVSGRGLEPRLIFPAGTREIGPTLPDDTASSEITVQNPCDFPVEFFATQFDTQFGIEQKILTWDNTFDRQHKMIVPPIEAGSGLPIELLEEYRDTLKMIQDQKQQIAEELQADASAMDVSSTVALAESATSIGRGKSRASNKGSAREQKEKEKEKEKKKEKKETKKEKEAREAAEAEAAEALRIAELEAARELAMSPMSRIQRSISNLGADITAGLPADFRRMSPQHFTQLLMDPQLGLQDNMPPSVRAICRSLGIDASTNGRQERRSQGIIIVVHGAPSSGKTTHAERLAEKYHVKSLTLDEVLQEAIDGLDDHGGAKASEYLIRARTQILVAHQRELEAAQQQAAANAAGKKGGKPGMSKKLSTSTLSGSGGNAHAPISPLASGKAQGVSSDAAGATPLSASTLTSPPAHTAHSAFPLDESIDPLLVERASTSRDDITVPLDEDIAVEILRHRLMRDEHYLGAIFDGLQTTILSDMDAAYRVIRRAVGNRRHFYFFDLYCDRSGLDQRDRRRPFFEYTEFDRPETPVVVELPDWRTIAEEDYLNLDEDTRRRVDEQQAMDKKQERLRKRQEKEEEERRIREAQEAEERRLEEEKNLKKKKKMSKHQLVGQSPSGSVANLVRRGSRPSSGAHQRSNSLLVPPDAAAAGLESKTSIGDAGELGKSKLAGASRSRFDSTMTLDKIADEATVVEDEVESARCPAADTPPFPADFDGELPGFPEYYASRATLPRVMGLWHPDDGGFVPDPEKPSPVEQAPPAGGTGKKGLGRVKETDSRADVAKPDSMAPAAAATQDKAEQDFEFPTYVSIDVQLPRPPQATEAPDGTDSRLFDYPYSVIEGLDELPVPSSARSTESDASSTANTDSLHSRIPKTSAIVLPMQCRQPSSVSREEQAEVDESAMHQLAKKLRVSIDQLYWPGKGELPARQTSLQSAHSMASTHSSGSTQHEGKTGREEDEQQHEQVEHGEQGQRRRSSGQQRPSTCSIESQAEPMMDMLYTTIAEDIGQSAELVAQYLDSLTPSLEEVIADIPFGPGNPTELPQATFQLVQHPGLDVEEMETENLACFSLMAEPAPPPPPEPVMEPFGGGQSAGSKEADSHATSEGTKKPGSSRSQKGSATSLGKKSGSGRKSVAKSPQPPKRSGRASAASEDSISSRPSTASLDQMSMASAEQKPPPVRPVHRWVVPPRGSVSFHVHFLRKVQSTVDKVLKFEIVGSRRRYDLFCRGISRYPDMNRLPQIIWPNMISRMPRGGAKPQRVFVTESKTYFFGSLLSGKPHDRMLEGRFPENMVKVKVINTTGLPITVDPSFERDDSGETFFVEPRNMVLPPAGKGALTISAFPRMKQDSVYVEDVLRIAFNQNPEPLIFGVTCWSSKPHLVAEPNEFPFSRVAMGRSVTKEVKIYNKSMLPVAFHVTGIKELGDEFTLDNDHGVIAPGDSATVKLTVKSLRAFALKKSLRLEVFDQDHTMGMVHSENLAVNCEVYDVLVDINYPKSPSGSEDSELEFAACRVYEEQKLTMHLRNKGKYTVNYQYHVDKKSLPDLGLTDAFCIIPQKGMLQPGEKPTAVAITFLPEVQVEMLRTPVIHLEILDPFCGGEQDESIAYVPCRVTCKAVFSRYNVQPAADLNFGTMIMQTRRERKFTLINSGEFEFKYQLMRYDGLVTPLATASHAKRLHAIENTQEKNKRAKEALARAAQAKKDFNSRFNIDHLQHEAVRVPVVEQKRRTNKSVRTRRGTARTAARTSGRTHRNPLLSSIPGLPLKGRGMGASGRASANLGIVGFPESKDPHGKHGQSKDNDKGVGSNKPDARDQKEQSSTRPTKEGTKEKAKLQQTGSEQQETHDSVFPENQQGGVTSDGKDAQAEGEKEKHARRASAPDEPKEKAETDKSQAARRVSFDLEAKTEPEDHRSEGAGKTERQHSTEEPKPARRSSLKKTSSSNNLLGQSDQPGTPTEGVAGGTDGKAKLRKISSSNRLSEAGASVDERTTRDSTGGGEKGRRRSSTNIPRRGSTAAGGNQAGSGEGDAAARRRSLSRVPSIEKILSESLKRKAGANAGAALDVLTGILKENDRRRALRVMLDRKDGIKDAAKPRSRIVDLPLLVQKCSMPEGMSGQGSNSRLLIGPFTCSPAMGSVAPGNQAIITVECHADSNARTDVLALDIADRAPEDNPNGFPYNLIMEACVPSVDTGLRDIFEEHNIVPSAAHISAPQMQRVYVGQGTLCEDERQFLFHSVFVGTQVKARLKLVNKTKLPCDINITIKGQNAKASMKLSDVFSVQPNKFSLDGKDMKLVTITFCPQAIQTYNCTFDIGVVDPAVLTSSVMSRGPKSQCQFDVCGEGALPRLSLLEPPAVVNTKNSVAEIEQTPLEFRRLLPHRCSVKMVVVKNHSPFSCEVEVRLVEHLDDARLVAFSFADGVDACTDVPDPAATDMPMVEPKQRRVKVPARLAARNATPFQSTSLQDALAGAATESDTPRKRSTMTLHVGAEETVRIAIKCAPKIVGSCQGELQVAAAGNPFEVARVKLLGEGYTDTLQVLGLEEVMSCFKMLKSTSIEKVDSTTRVAVDKKETKKQQQQNLRSESRVSTCPEEAVRCWHVDFGGTEVKAKKSLHFTITNHDANSVLKFKFIMPALDAKTTLTCVPSFGHIGPGRTKTIHASIVAKKPISVERLCFSCKTVRINYVSQGEVDVQTLDAEDWDEQSVVAQIVEAVPTHKIGAFEMPDHLVRPIRQLQEEPEHTAVDRSARDLAFAVSMECEYATYECPMANAVDDAMPTVEFKSTAFYQARDLLLPLTNTSKVDMRYKWAINDETDVGSTPSLPPLSAAPTDLFDALLLPLKRRHQLPAFFIEPSEGTVAAGGTVTFKVTFRPVVPDKSTIKLTCSIPNLSPTLDPPAMTLVGNGIVPIAHLDLPPSDYLTGARRAVELKTEPEHTLPTGAQLHVNTKVMEFTSHAQQPTARDFRVANPTSRPWKYVWEMNPITPRDAENAFKITTVEGVIDAGKRNKMVIEFAPSNTRFLEGFWNFTIPEHRLSIPFLLVGRMTDPDVTLSTIALNFGSTLTGRKVKRSLEIINTEEVFVEYSFSDPSRKVDLHTANVSVSPRQGKVPPRSRKTIDVEMSLFVEKEISFSISCKVKGMLKTLPLNIKAEGYTVHVEGTMESPATDGKTITKQLDLAPNFNIVDFGKVQVNEKVVRTISVYNNGRFPTVYQWAVTQACDDPGGCAPSDVHSGKGRRKLISLKPNLKGSIEPAASQKFTIVFCPSQKKVLSGCEAVCQMAYGPSFRVVFAGEGTKPSLHFSFTKHNFGACFAGRPAETGQKKTLTIKNDHSQPVSIKCLPFKTDHLSVAFKAGIMPPGASKEALFQFHPRTVGKVQEVVQFDVNGLSTTNVRFAGEGTALKVEVADPEQSFIKLKTIQPRQTCSRTVKLVNRSLAPITFDVGLSPRATLDASVLTVKPHSDIQLGPGAACNVVVTFSPTGRMPRFSEEIIMEYANAVMPLFTVSAACIAREVSLDFRRLTFGEVVLGSSTQRRITMKNSGDLSTQYQWDAGKFGPDFAISPMDGVIEAGMEVHFTVSFKPVRLSKDIRYENLLCRLENAAALQLTLTGVCIARTTTREPIQFSCHVRSKDVKTIQIKNPTNQAWVLRPVIEGHYWSGAESVTVDPLSTKPYEVTYKPVVMTADGRKHQGNAFIALPDGNAIYYTFLGSAQEAKVVTVPSREWPCKKELNEEFTISNWLKTPQRFNVKIDIIKPDKNDPATNIHGLDYVDVPAGGKAGYQLRFRAHREGTTSMRLTFRNPDTREHLVYLFAVKSTSPEMIKTITLRTPVRQGIPHTIVVHNPLESPVVFSAVISCNEISLPQQFTVPGKSDGECTLQYLPLKVGRSSTKLTFSSHELGSYGYELAMEASLPPPEQSLFFRTTLGDKQVQTCHFTNFARTKTEYLCKVDDSNFLVERSISALAAVPGGTALSTEVTFEPQWLGDFKGTLTIASSSGGEYQFPVKGTCLQPKPQGPMVVKGHATTTIPFKNVFAKPAKFHFSIDNPAFTLRSTSDTLRARKVYYIGVSCETGHTTGSSKAAASQPPPPPPTGTLTVSCTAESLKEAGLPCSETIQWVFYVRGVP